MKKKNTIIISSVVAVLLIIVAVTAVLNAGDVEEKKALQLEAVIRVTSEGEVLGNIDMDMVAETGPVDFSADLDTSDSGPEEHLYTGIPMSGLFENMDIDVSDYSTVIAKAIDGYNVAYNASEVSEDDNIYIAIKRDGQPLGTKSTGGSGPYQVIVRKDDFSQRWCKFVIELELIR